MTLILNRHLVNSRIHFFSDICIELLMNVTAFVRCDNA